MVLISWLRRNWLRAIVHLLALWPLGWMFWTYTRGGFLVDPIREITTLTGRAGLALLLLSLACSPLSAILGIQSLVRVRRPLGLYSFLYVALHFLTFAGLDYRFELRFLVPAIFDQLFVLPGMVAGFILLVLAVTSTRGWQKRLGRGWKHLHRLAYLAGALAVLHFAWLVKEYSEPLRYAAVLAVLLALRFPPVREAFRSLRRRWID